jgi:acyl carrier protein
MFKVLENDPMLEEIKEYVKEHLDEEYPEDVTTESGHPERNGKI